MTLFTKIDNSPAALSTELAAAKEAYEGTRQSVIDRGCRRSAELVALRDEVSAEIAHLDNVLAAA